MERSVAKREVRSEPSRTTMQIGPTRKYDFQNRRRRDAANKADYRQRFKEEGPDPRIGTRGEWSVRRAEGGGVQINLAPALRYEKAKLTDILERHLKFRIGAEVGTATRLRKRASLRRTVEDRLEFMRNSILRAQVIAQVEHPESGRIYGLLEFKCPLRPDEPVTRPIFMKLFAFAMKLVGPALAEPETVAGNAAVKPAGQEPGACRH